MNYFQSPVFDLLKLGQMMKRPVSRKSFASHVVDLASQLSLGIAEAKSLNQARELLHNQIARLKWKTYIWVFPVQSYALGHFIYPVQGYEDVIPNSLLCTATKYRDAMHSSDPDARYYCRSLICSGLEWACYKGQREGCPNLHGDIPQLQDFEFNAFFPTGFAPRK